MVDAKGNDVPRRNYRYARPAVKALLDAVVMDKKPLTLYDKDTGNTLCASSYDPKRKSVTLEIHTPRRLSLLLTDTPRRKS